jgi:hypothetical protein
MNFENQSNEIVRLYAIGFSENPFEELRSNIAAALKEAHELGRSEAEARIEELEQCLRDYEQHGLRADLNPTQPMGDWMEVSRFYLDYLKRIEESVKDRARTALAKRGKGTV